MKILLIEPQKSPVTLGGEDVFVYEPLALEYVAAGVTQKHDVRILDLRLERRLQPVLDEFQPHVVGITAYTVHVNTVRRLFDQIKAWDPVVLTVVGGHHATLLPEDLTSPSIDLIVMGEGVNPFREIVERFEVGDGFAGIPGLAYRKGGRLEKTGFSPAVDLDNFPYPARELTARYRKRYYSEWMKPLASLRTSKGCPFRCSFCALWKITGGRYLRRKPENIVKELAAIDEPYVFFADDESLLDAPRMRTLARQIKEAGIRKGYFLYSRSDTIAKNPDLLETWREVGLERVFVGLEFFRDEDLHFIRKGSTVANNAQAVKILQDLDIEIFPSFILRPEFGRQDFGALARYCRQLELTFASFAVLTPLPGTDFYQEVESRLITRDYDYFDFVHTLLPTELPLKEFYREFSQLFRRAVPPARGVSTLKRFRWHELPRILMRSLWWQNRVRRAYLDYDDAGGIRAAS